MAARAFPMSQDVMMAADPRMTLTSDPQDRTEIPSLFQTFGGPDVSSGDDEDGEVMTGTHATGYGGRGAAAMTISNREFEPYSVSGLVPRGGGAYQGNSSLMLQRGAAASMSLSRSRHPLNRSSHNPYMMLGSSDASHHTNDGAAMTNSAVAMRPNRGGNHNPSNNTSQTLLKFEFNSTSTLAEVGSGAMGASGVMRRQPSQQLQQQQQQQQTSLHNEAHTYAQPTGHELLQQQQQPKITDSLATGYWRNGNPMAMPNPDVRPSQTTTVGTLTCNGEAQVFNVNVKQRMRPAASSHAPSLNASNQMMPVVQPAPARGSPSTQDTSAPLPFVSNPSALQNRPFANGTPASESHTPSNSSAAASDQRGLQAPVDESEAEFAHPRGAAPEVNLVQQQQQHPQQPLTQPLYAHQQQLQHHQQYQQYQQAPQQQVYHYNMPAPPQHQHVYSYAGYQNQIYPNMAPASATHYAPATAPSPMHHQQPQQQQQHQSPQQQQQQQYYAAQPYQQGLTAAHGAMSAMYGGGQTAYAAAQAPATYAPMGTAVASTYGYHQSMPMQQQQQQQQLAHYAAAPLNAADVETGGLAANQRRVHAGGAAATSAPPQRSPAPAADPLRVSSSAALGKAVARAKGPAATQPQHADPAAAAASPAPVSPSSSRKLPKKVDEARFHANHDAPIRLFVVVRRKTEGQRYACALPAEEVPAGSYMLVEGDRGADLGEVLGHVSLEQMAYDCAVVERRREAALAQMLEQKAGIVCRGTVESDTAVDTADVPRLAGEAALTYVTSLKSWPRLIGPATAEDMTSLEPQREAEKQAFTVAKPIVQQFIENRYQQRVARNDAIVAAVAAAAAAAKGASAGGDGAASAPSMERRASMTPLSEEGLKMLELSREVTLVDCEYQFTREKITLYVSRPSRSIFVDFRSMQRKLFRTFRCRIWIAYMDEVSHDKDAPESFVFVPPPSATPAAAGRDEEDEGEAA